LSNDLYAYIFINIYIKIYKIRIQGRIKTNGKPYININKDGYLEVGSNFVMNNGNYYNQIGRNDICHLIVGKNAHLIIGNDVGISSTTIVCEEKVVIGNRVKIGGNTVIYDTDFHSLDYLKRQTGTADRNNTNTSPVKIGDDVFIGAHSTILKGVNIGDRVIIGACSVITKNIPPDEIWAGNPAKFIRKI
jgi:acetyltransferase-like isoleucine patch superfamily enzyme